MGLNAEEKKKLFSIFDNIDNTSESDGLNKSQDSDVLLIDGYNLFFRAWAVSPFMNEDGVHTGGISSFLKSLGYSIKLLNPTRCVLVFDGAGGSMRRRKIHPEYKQKRKTSIRINRAYIDNVDSKTEQDSIKKQLFRVIQYIDCLPITTIAIDNIEADDTIAYLAQDFFKNENVTIMSADKDFLQLVNQRIKVWSPIKKKLYGCAEIFNEYGLSCENFLNYRVLEGDVSDNIEGVKGAGLKTILKLFPIFTEHRRYSIDEIFAYSDANKGKYKLYDTILNNKDVVRRNYDLMQLCDSQIQTFSQLRINEVMDKPINRINRFQFIGMMREDKIWNNIPNGNLWLNEVFNKLDNYITKKTA